MNQMFIESLTSAYINERLIKSMVLKSYKYTNKRFIELSAYMNQLLIDSFAIMNYWVIESSASQNQWPMNQELY